MENQIQLNDNNTAAMMEKALLTGDLSKMSSTERLQYYSKVCDSIGLNPLTRPFDYITLNGKLTLYAKKDTTEQLRKINGISIKITDRQMHDGIYVVTAMATDKTGRTDEAIGAVSLGNLKGDALANALMKAETKAKRRVTLSIAGLGWLDETEVDSIPDAKMVNVTEDGEIVQPVKAIPVRVESLAESFTAQDLNEVTEPVNVTPIKKDVYSCESCGAEITEKVWKFKDLHKCMKCQKEVK